jgi:lipopolysaccharide transport system ATP-binding protein
MKIKLLAIDLYYTRFAVNDSNVVFDDGTIKLLDAKMVDAKTHKEIQEIKWGEDLKFYFKFKLLKDTKVPVFNIIIFDKEQRPVAMFERNNEDSEIVINKKNEIEFFLEHKQVQLSKGVYSLNIAISNVSSQEPILRINDLITFQIKHDKDVWQPFLLKSNFTNN